MSDNQLQEAIQNLGTTIGSISGKIQQEKTGFANIKRSILEQIQQLSSKINDLRNRLRFVPQLKQQLEKCNKELLEKDKLLQIANASIAELDERIEKTQEERERIDELIESKNNEINELKTDNDTNQQQINTLQNEINNLNRQKEAVERQLSTLQGQVANIVASINDLNTRLSGEINNINTIVEEFQQGEDVSDMLVNISQNIQGIIDSLQIDEQRGGKRGKTRRKRKQLKGGYVYPSSKELDKSSSIISSSTSKGNSKRIKRGTKKMKK